MRKGTDALWAGASAGRLDGHKDRIDFSQNLRVFEPENPAVLFLIIGLEESQTVRWTLSWPRFMTEDPLEFTGGDANLYAYVWNSPVNLRDPLGLSASSAAVCFLKGAGVGAGGAVLIGGLAVVAGTLGAPVAAVTLGLGIIAAGGALGLGADIGANIANGNRDGLAYDAGSVVGGALAGGFAGRSIAEGVNRVPSPPWSLKSDRGQGFNPNLGSVWDWLGTGPNPGSAAGSAASGGAGAASMAGRSCGC